MVRCPLVEVLVVKAYNVLIHDLAVVWKRNKHQLLPHKSGNSNTYSHNDVQAGHTPLNSEVNYDADNNKNSPNDAIITSCTETNNHTSVIDNHSANQGVPLRRSERVRHPVNRDEP